MLTETVLIQEQITLVQSGILTGILIVLRIPEIIQLRIQTVIARFEVIPIRIADQVLSQVRTTTAVQDRALVRLIDLLEIIAAEAIAPSGIIPAALAAVHPQVLEEEIR
jgi:hypothetical protein